MRKFLYPLILSLFFLALVTIPEPDYLRVLLLEGFLYAAVILVPLQLFASNKKYSDSDPATRLWTIGILAGLITGIFWFRSTIGSFGFEGKLGLEIYKTFFFWIPAVLFASLYRSFGEGWKPADRRTLLIRLLVAFAGSLIGLGVHEFARERIDQVPFEYSLHHVERQLPDSDSQIDYWLERSVLHMEVTLNPFHEEPNIRSLQRIRAISSHASHLISRKDTDSLALRITRGGRELATLNWPDPETNRPADRIRFNYTDTGLSNLPTERDLELLFETIGQVFRPENLAAGLYENTLILRWKGDNTLPDDAALIPFIIQDWQAVNHTITRAACLYEGLEVFRIIMPGHNLEVPADCVQGLYRVQQHIPVRDFTTLIQLYDSEEMPDPPDLSDNVPVRIIWGDGEFDTRRNTTGPLWPWEKGILAGYHFYTTELDNNEVVRFVIHPAGTPEDARWITLHPGETKQLFTIYLKYLK